MAVCSFFVYLCKTTTNTNYYETHILFTYTVRSTPLGRLLFER